MSRGTDDVHTTPSLGATHPAPRGVGPVTVRPHSTCVEPYSDGHEGEVSEESGFDRGCDI